MGEESPLDDERVLFGLQRVKPAFENCQYPSKIAFWFGIQDQRHARSGPPARIGRALTALDAFVSEWPEMARVSDRLSLDCHSLTAQFLGLDCNGNASRIRAAVARAYGAAWRYADQFCDWRDALETSDEVVSTIQAFVEHSQWDIQTLAEIRDKLSFEPEPGKDVSAYLTGLQSFAEKANAWADGQRKWKESFPANPPRLFLILRLIEIYACFSGEVPPLHITHKDTENSEAPDQRLRRFLEAALMALAVPAPMAGLNGVLRDIGKRIPECPHRLRRLSLEGVDHWGRGLIDYAYLPSVGMQITLNCFSNDEL